MSEHPTISIIIVNRDDPRITDTLEALERMRSDRDVEVIVVDASQGRLDHVRAAVPRVRWIEFAPPPGSARTIARQRNAGLRAAVGSVIVFLDANCVPEEGWLDALVSPLLEGGEAIVSGSVRSREKATFHDRSDPYDLNAGYLTECATINVALLHEVFDVVGDFDESIGFAEDVDFTWRAVDKGFRIYFAREAVVSHDWDGWRGDLERAVRYGVGRVRLLRKHPDRLGRLVGLDLNMVVYPLFLLCLPIAILFPWYVLILVVPLVKNRRRSPFSTVAYGLAFGSGVLSEFLHVPILRSQRRI